MRNEFDRLHKKLRHYTLTDSLKKNLDSPVDLLEFLKDGVLLQISHYYKAIKEDSKSTIEFKLKEIKRVKNLLIGLYSKNPVENTFDRFNIIQEYYSISLFDLYEGEKTVETFVNKEICNFFLMCRNVTPDGFHELINEYNLYYPYSNVKEDIQVYYFSIYCTLKLYTVQKEIKLLIEKLEYWEDRFDEHSNALYVDDFFNHLSYNLNSKVLNLKEIDSNIKEQYEILKIKLDGSCYECILRPYPKTDIKLVLHKFQSKTQEIADALFFTNEKDEHDYMENKIFLTANGIPDYKYQNPYSDEFYENITQLPIYSSAGFTTRLNNYRKLFKHQISISIEKVLEEGRLRILDMMDYLQPEERLEDWVKKVASEYFNPKTLAQFDILVRQFLISKPGGKKLSYSKCLSVWKYLKEINKKEGQTFKVKKEDYMNLLKKIHVIDKLPSKNTRNIDECDYETNLEQMEKILEKILRK
jgi:hypothetical protein